MSELWREKRYKHRIVKGKKIETQNCEGKKTLTETETKKLNCSEKKVRIEKNKQLFVKIIK